MWYNFVHITYFKYFFLTVSQNNFGNKIPIPTPMVPFIPRTGLHLQLGQRKYNSEILHFFVALAIEQCYSNEPFQALKCKNGPTIRELNGSVENS